MNAIRWMNCRIFHYCTAGHVLRYKVIKTIWNWQMAKVFVLCSNRCVQQFDSQLWQEHQANFTTLSKNDAAKTTTHTWFCKHRHNNNCKKERIQKPGTRTTTTTTIAFTIFVFCVLSWPTFMELLKVRPNPQMETFALNEWMNEWTNSEYEDLYSA